MESPPNSRKLERLAHLVSRWTGSDSGFIAALSTILIWLCAGSWLGFNAKWENLLMIYIATLTFLMVFLIQRVQNKELLAIHVKLNELVAATRTASNDVIGIEKRTEDEIMDAHGAYVPGQDGGSEG